MLITSKASHQAALPPVACLQVSSRHVFNPNVCRQSRGNSVFHLAPNLPVVALYRIDVATWPDGCREGGLFGAMVAR